MTLKSEELRAKIPDSSVRVTIRLLTELVDGDVAYAVQLAKDDYLPPIAIRELLKFTRKSARRENEIQNRVPKTNRPLARGGG